jgi:hypothetical protein
MPTNLRAVPLTVAFGLITAVVAVGQSRPVLFFSDLDSGPNTGGENNRGAYVSVYGRNFGSSPGSVSVGGRTVASYPVWTNTKITFQLGSNTVSGDITVTTSAGTSNGVPFTVRSGNIYFVATSGSDGNSGLFGSPWRTMQHAIDTIAPGDIIYVMNGVSESSPGSSDGSVQINRNHGTATHPKALVAYPNAVATIGATAGSPCSSTQCTEGLKAVYASSWWTVAGLRLVGNNLGLLVKGENWRVVGNEFTCPFGDGASACFDTTQAAFVKFYGNNVHDVGYAGSSALYHGIYYGTDSNHIDMGWNTVARVQGCRGVQIHSSPTSNARTDGFNQYDISIHDNIIHDTQCDGIVLATVDPSKGAIRVYNNVIYRAGKGPPTPEQGGNFACVYVAGTTNAGSPGGGTVEVFNNTMSDCGSYEGPNGRGGILAGTANPALKVRIRNNIVVQNNGRPYAFAFGCTTCDNLNGSNNLFFGNGQPVTNPNVVGSLTVDPQFVGGDDYHLRSTSPARGAGVNTGISADIEGVLRGTSSDLGAYQFAPAPPVVIPGPPTALPPNPANGPFREDFERGDPQDSAYGLVSPAPNALFPEGVYTMTTNPRSVHDSFCSFGDHTSGSGRMFVANGTANPSRVWTRGVTGLTPNQQYTLSLYAASAFTVGPAQLRFDVNGVQLSPQLTTPLFGGLCPSAGTAWQRLETTFTVSSSNLIINLMNLATSVGGNDFAIDDIELNVPGGPTPPPPPPATPPAPPPAPTPPPTSNGPFLENFEGSTSQGSDYPYVAPSNNTVLFPESRYTITTNPQAVHYAFCSFGDHTSGTGKMMVVNGGGSASSVWSRNVTGLTSGQQYTLSLYAASAFPTGPAQLEFQAGGTTLQPTLTAPIYGGACPGAGAAWQRLQVSFTASSSSVTIKVVNRATSVNGNDFAIDDVQLATGGSAPPPPTNGLFREDFEATASVTSDYSFVAPSNNTALFREGIYTIASNPNSVHSAFCSFGDHTSGGGRMLIANGGGTAASVWSRSVTGLTAGQQYTFRLYVASAYPQGPAQLQLRLNGSPLGATVGAPIYGGACPSTATAWQVVEAGFTATGSPITLSVMNLATPVLGNDFALDDIQLVLGPSASPPSSLLKDDFETSTTHGSQYTFVAPANNTVLFPSGVYTVATNPRAVHNLFCSFGDHTSGTGKMLIANGGSSQSTVWSRSISGLVVGRQYRMRLYAASAYPLSPAQLQFRVNGTALAPTLTLSINGGACPGSAVWQGLETTFTAPATTATIAIVNLTTAASGNDFAIDDVEVLQ